MNVKSYIIIVVIMCLVPIAVAQKTDEPTTGTLPGRDKTSPHSRKEEAKMSSIQGKKVVMIIARDNFRDEELFKTREVLESQGVEVTVASSSLATAVGMLGGKAKPDILYSDIKVEDFDALIFVGGMGATEYWDDQKAHVLAHSTLEQGKVLAAICIAPVTLAKAGLLKGKKATVWHSENGKLSTAGASYTGSAVEQDGKIITGNGPTAAEEFGKTIAKALLE
jgi:protease I